MGPGDRERPMDTTENVHLVPTEHLADQFIDALRPRSACLLAGATILPGLLGDVSIPGFATASAFGWLAEDADSADTEPTTKTISLIAKNR